MAVATAQQAAAERVGEREHQSGGISCFTSKGEIGYHRGQRRLVLKPGSAASKNHGASEIKPDLLALQPFADTSGSAAERDTVEVLR